MTAAPSEPPVQRLLIAGGGTAGWMTAALLGRLFGRHIAITLVESEEIGTVGVGEATIPALHTFHDLLGIAEPEFMAATQATFKLGIRFEGWKAIASDYIHSFGGTGKDHWSAGFQHFWLKAQAAGWARPYGDYCLELRAAEEQRFAHLPQPGLNYAYHLDAGRYARFLRQRAEADGVRRVEGRIEQVEQHPHNGHIAALRLADGQRLAADLFVDCTGFRALLLGQTLGVGYEDWRHWLPCDRAVAVQTEAVQDAPPYTRAIAHPFGWQWRIPLQHRVGNGLVFSSAELGEGEAPERLLRAVEGRCLVEPRVLRFTPGQRHRVWEKNCVAIGLSSGFIEPLESTSIHLIQRAAIRLAQLFPAGALREADINEFNRQTEQDLVHIRDFIILHYTLNARGDSALWRHCAAMALPDTLRQRIELFRASARVFRPADQLFAENSWIQVMLGQGVQPQGHHPAADLMDEAELRRFLGGIQQQVERAVAGMPPHLDYVKRLLAPLQVALPA